MAGQALRPNHALTLLKGGDALFPAMVQAIDAAHSEVLLETYMFDFARSVLQVAQALERAAARGTEVETQRRPRV
jgi:cardiolipin synthase A/B